jgi:hypothetical protein
MMTLNAVAKIGVGVVITGAAVRILKVSNPVSILGLAVAGQALAWMPSFVSRCLRTLRPPSLPHFSTPPNEALTRTGRVPSDHRCRAGASGRFDKAHETRPVCVP